MSESTGPTPPPILADMAASGGAPRDFTPGQVTRLRHQLNSSLYLYAHYIMGFDQLEPLFHGQMCNYIENWGKPGYRRAMMQSPRDSLKSSIGTVANAPWQICREPDQPVVMFNEVENNTANWIRAIRNTVERSPLFHAVYKDLLPRGVGVNDTRSKSQSLRWNDSALDFEGRRYSDPEPSISGFGVGGASTGHHWPKIIFDDLIGPKHRDSPAEMERVRNWLKTHLELMRPAKNGMAFCICTPWTIDDVYVDLTQLYRYVLYRRAALENAAGEADLNGTPVLARYVREELLAAAALDFSVFSSQSMCRPLPAGELALDPQTLRWYHIENDVLWIEPQFVRENESSKVPLYKLRKAIFLDPAPAEKAEIKAEPRSRNGIVVVGIDAYGRIFVLESVAKRCPLPETCDLLFSLARKWEADLLFVEEVNFSVSYRHWILRDQQPGQKWSGVRLTPRPMHPGKRDKDKRIQDMAPAFQRGEIYFNRIGCTALHNEFLTYHPGAAERDTLDALAYVREHLFRPQREEEKRRAERADRDADLQRCPVTGY